MRRHSIRWFLGIAALLATVAASQARGACELMQYTMVQATPHVYVFVGAEGTTGIVNGNTVAVIGRDAILLVDTGQFEGASRVVLEQIRKLSRLPIRYIVNTHWHGDHLLANSVFKDAFPQAQIIAHSHTLAQANRYYEGYAEKSAQRFPTILDDMKKRMEASTSSDERTWLQATLDCAEIALPEIKQTRYVAADKTVDDHMEIDLGGLPVVIQHIGVGNTAGDLVVVVKTDKLVATGDMVVYPAPYAIGSNLEPWPATLDRLMSLGASTYVPGHGHVFRDTEYIRDVQQLLKEMRGQLITLYSQKVAKKDAAAQVNLEDFQKKYINSPMRRQAFAQFFIRSAIQKYWTDMESKAAAPEAPKPQ